MAKFSEEMRKKEKDKKKRDEERRKLLGTGMAGKAAEEMIKRQAYLDSI